MACAILVIRRAVAEHERTLATVTNFPGTNCHKLTNFGSAQRCCDAASRRDVSQFTFVMTP
jgi:hypothetical protein